MEVSFKVSLKILMFSVVILLDSVSSFYLYTVFQDSKNSYNCVKCESNLWNLLAIHKYRIEDHLEEIH